MNIEINRILNEARAIGCSDLHFTYGINPIVRLNGALRKMTKYPEMDEEEIEEKAKENGTRLLRDNVSELVQKGITSMDELVRVTYAV